MELVKIEIEAPKELYELEKFLVELVADLLAKKPMEAILAENLQNLLKAIEGVEKLPAELKEKEALNVALLLAGDVFKILKK